MEKLISEHQSITEEKPSIWGNSIIIFCIMVMSKILGWASFTYGIGQVIAGLTQGAPYKFIGLISKFDETDEKMANVTGSLLLVISALFFLSSKLCRMLIKRNMFALGLYEWSESAVSTLKQNSVPDTFQRSEKLN